MPSVQIKNVPADTCAVFKRRAASDHKERLGGQDLAAPELIDLEVVSVLGRQVSVGRLDARRARLVLDDLHAVGLCIPLVGEG